MTQRDLYTHIRILYDYRASRFPPVYSMRLLKYDTLSAKWHIDDFTGRPVPFYAILSHTWSPDDERVTFEKVSSLSVASRADLWWDRKLHFTREKATEDGLIYFWIDTCCIKKSDSTELQRSLNSMFYWYQRAARCYVLLGDVSIDDKVDGKIPMENGLFEESVVQARLDTTGAHRAIICDLLFERTQTSGR